MGEPARATSKEDALTALTEQQDNGVILLEGTPSTQQVSLDGWNPVDQSTQDGNVCGVVIRYLATGTKQGQPSSGAAPDRLDPRNALALIRLCQWLADSYGVSELYHLGISGGGVDKQGNLRTDCHGQGRAIDLVGVKGVTSDGSEFHLTVSDDWARISTAVTPGGDWPSGTGSNVSYRLDDPDADPFASTFFRDLYQFVTSEWQDRSDTPDPADAGTIIGERSFVMHPDHPATAPGTPHGREAHWSHLHMQIGVTGTEN